MSFYLSIAEKETCLSFLSWTHQCDTKNLDVALFSAILKFFTTKASIAFSLMWLPSFSLNASMVFTDGAGFVFLQLSKCRSNVHSRGTGKVRHRTEGDETL